MNKEDIKVSVKLGNILNAPLSTGWDYISDKHGFSEWCLNEGTANIDDEIEISLEDAEYIGVIKVKE